MPRRGSCVTARQAWALHGWSYFRYQFSLRQTCQYRTIQHDSSWPIRSSKTQKKITFAWLIRHVFTPRRAEEQVARRATFWHKMVNLGDKFPDFEVDTSKGKIKFYEAIEGKWVLHVHLHNIFKKITSLNELVRGQLKFTMQEDHEVSKTLRFLSSSMIYSIDVTIKFIKG